MAIENGTIRLNGLGRDAVDTVLERKAQPGTWNIPWPRGAFFGRAVGPINWTYNACGIYASPDRGYPSDIKVHWSTRKSYSISVTQH
jgi:hypothetical protein